MCLYSNLGEVIFDLSAISDEAGDFSNPAVVVDVCRREDESCFDPAPPNVNSRCCCCCCIGGVWQFDDALESEEGDAAKKSSSSKPASDVVDEAIESEDSVREEPAVLDLGIAVGWPEVDKIDLDCCCCDFVAECCEGEVLAAAAASCGYRSYVNKTNF